MLVVMVNLDFSGGVQHNLIFLSSHLTLSSHLPVYDGLEVRVALLGDVRVARGGLRLPRELLPHSAARDDRHHQLGLAEPYLQVAQASKHHSSS